MMSRWSLNRVGRLNPDDITERAEASLAATRGQQAYVNSITSYLEKRKGQNGFGEDFDVTFLVDKGSPDARSR